MKNLALLITITTACLISSCGNPLSKALTISANEDKGVKEVLENYGGYCKYAIGFSSSMTTGKKKYFELELSKSEMIDERAEIAEMPASNVAYLFYKNLNQKEQNSYESIHTVLIFSNTEKMTFEYSTEQLELVEQRMEVVNKVVGLIKEKKFKEIQPMISNELSFDKDKLIANLETLDPQFGNVTEGFMPFGFRITEINGVEILHISGAIIRDKQNNEFSVDLDLNGTDDVIYALDYKI